MSGTLALASAIAEMERPALLALVRERRPQSAASILDPIGLASDLLRPESVARAVSRLSAPELSLLLRFAHDGAATGQPSGRDRDPDLDPDQDALATLAALGLIGVNAGERVALPEVEEAIVAGLAQAGRPQDSLLSPAEPAETSDADVNSDAWVDTALSAVGRCAECLRQLSLRPIRLNRTGAVSYAGAKAVSERTGIDVSGVQDAFEVAGLAGLASRVPGEQLLVAGTAAQLWLDADPASRWLALAEGVLGALGGPLRSVVALRDGDLAGAARLIGDRFPLLPADEREAATRSVELAQSVGLLIDGRLSGPARLILDGHPGEARERVERAFPPLAEGVYLQPDLSVIVPGPLPPPAEAALAELTVSEHIGIASTRRISESAVAEALERGLTADAARALLADLSLTGVPQPLDYLVTSLAERVGGIVVSEHDGDEARARIVVSRATLADTLLVDRALQHLQLRRSDTEPGTLFSRLRSEHVVAALTDARYHASAQSDREIRLSDTQNAGVVARAEAKGSEPVDSREELLTALVDRVFESARTEPGTGDFMRRLELAIRERRPVLVTAEAGGQSRSFTLLPVSVNGGRLRASDQAAGVERTLPVNLITSVEAV